MARCAVMSQQCPLSVISRRCPCSVMPQRHLLSEISARPLSVVSRQCPFSAMSQRCLGDVSPLFGGVSVMSRITDFSATAPYP